MAEARPRKQHLRTAMQGAATQLAASLKQSASISDSLTKGELREEDVVRAFEPYIADRYKMFKGIVVNAYGEESDPQDLVLLDSAVLPTIGGGGTTRVIPVEGVVGTIQVKSLATRAEIERAVKNIASSKRLLPDTERFGIPIGATEPGWWKTGASHFGGILFLAARGTEPHLHDAYCEAVMKVPPRERPDALCVLDRFAILWGNPSTGEGLRFAARGAQGETPMVLEAGDDSLLFFYMTLVEHLRNWITPPFRWMDYVFGADRVAYEGGMEFSYSYYYDEENPPDWVTTTDMPPSG